MTTPESTHVNVAGLALKQIPDGSYPVDGINPHPHQREIFNLLSDPSAPSAFINTAPTGAGKTLSWVAPAAAMGLNTIALFPTNALVQDQAEAVRGLLQRCDGGGDVTVCRVDSDTVEAHRKAIGADSQGAALEDLLDDAFADSETVFLLTNPDTYVLVQRGFYAAGIRHHYHFDLAIVDEYHRADRKERNTILYLLDELWADDESSLEQIGYLSATPEKRLTNRIRRRTPVDLSVVGGSGVNFAPGGVPAGHRAIMPPISLDVHPAAFYTAADAIVDDGDDVVDFCREGRTAVILDGVREVAIAHEMLSRELSGAVERIDGLHRGAIIDRLRRFDTLVSNSAVEVGIDFDIDRLIFSAIDSSAFLQRLGRLRNQPSRALARAYVPHAVVDALDGISSASWQNRSKVAGVIDRGYPEVTQTPPEFDRYHSAAEAYADARVRSGEPTEEQLVRIARHFYSGYGVDIETDAERLRDAYADGDGYAAHLRLYRDGGLTAAVYDPEQGRVQPYRIPYLLRYGDVEFVYPNEFFDRIPDRLEDDARVARRVASGGCCIYHGRIASDSGGRGFSVDATPELEAMVEYPNDNEPAVVDNISFLEWDHDQKPVEGLSILNDVLDGADILCYPSILSPRDARRRYGLPPTTYLYPFQSSAVSRLQQSKRTRSTGSIAFGHNALHLHVLERRYGSG